MQKYASHINIKRTYITLTQTKQGGGGPLCNCTNAGEFTNNFACNYGDRGNWSGGVKTFLDSISSNSIVTNITAILYFFLDTCIL